LELNLTKTSLELVSHQISGTLPSKWKKQQIVRYYFPHGNRSEQMHYSHLFKLTPDLILKIFWYLDYPDLRNFFSTCKIFKQAFEETPAVFSESSNNLSVIDSLTYVTRTLWFKRFWKFIFSSTRNYESAVHQFAMWPLIPLVNNSLCSCGMIDYVFILPISKIDSVLADIFRYLDIPILCQQFCEYFEITYSTKDQWRYVLKQLIFAREVWGISLEDKLTNREYLLEYFSQVVDLTKDDIKKLRSLPIFQNIDEKWISIGTNEYYILQQQNQFFQPNAQKFLAPNDYLPLLSALGVIELSESDIFVKFLIPEYNNLSEDEKAKRCEYIRLNFDKLSQNPLFVEAMKYLPFVPLSDGRIVRPAEAYGESKILSEIFDQKGSYPVGVYTSDAWYSILVRLGLKTDLTAKKFIECAVHIQNEYISNDNLDRFQLKSKLLLSYMKENYSKLAISEHFEENISKIKFICARDLVSRRKVSACLTECILEKDWFLGWTKAPIISPSDLPIQHNLNICSPPNPKLILAHLSDFDDKLLENWSLPEGEEYTIKSAFKNILLYLNNSLDLLDSTTIIILRNVKLIPVEERRLVKPCRIYFGIKEGLIPFLNLLSPEYLEFVQLLKILGAKKVPTIEDLVQLFQDIEKEYNQVLLDPNELNAYIKLLKMSANILTENIPDIPVPNELGILVPKSTCYFNDVPWFSSRISYDHLNILNIQIPKELCTSLQIYNLSSVLKESLDMKINSAQINLDLSNHITSELFSQGLFQFIKYYYRNNNNEYIRSLTPTVIKALLNSYKIMFVDQLHTTIIYCLGNTEKNITRNTQGSISFLDKQNRIILYTNLPPSITLANILERNISNILQLDITLPLSPILHCPISEILTIVELLQMTDWCSIDMHRGTPGQLLIPKDRELLTSNPSQKFLSNEIVAFRDGEGHLRYAEFSMMDRDKPDCVQIVIGKNQVVLLPSTNVYTFKSGSVQQTNSITVAKDSTIEHIHRSIEKDEYFVVAKDLLSMAGLPLDVSQTNLLKEMVKLRNDCNMYRDEIAKKDKLIEVQKKEIEESTWLCIICKERDIDITLCPCGHTACYLCIAFIQKQKNNNFNCFICRTPVTGSMKFFKS